MLVNDVDVLEGIVTMELLGHTGGLPRCQYPGYLRVGDPVEVQETSELYASLKSAYGSMRLRDDIWHARSKSLYL